MFDEIATAMLFRRLAPVAIGVALFAYFGRSRLVFVLGMLGLLLGFIVPQARIYANYNSVEGASLAALYDHVHHVAFWSTSGALVGTLAGYVVLLIRSWRQSRDEESTDLLS